MIDTLTIDIQKRKYLNEHSLNEDYCFDYVSDLQKKWLGSYDAKKLIDIFYQDNNLDHEDGKFEELIKEDSDFNQFYEYFFSISKKIISMIDPEKINEDFFSKITKKLALHTYKEITLVQYNNISNFYDFGPGSGRILIGLFCFFKMKKISSFNYIALEGSTVHIVYLNILINFLKTYLSDEKNVISSSTIIGDNYKFENNLENSAINLKLYSLWSHVEKKFEGNNILFANDYFDQISKFDFNNSLKIIKNLFDNNSLLISKGGVEKSHLKNLYLFGYGTYHGDDIEKNIREKLNLKCVDSQLMLNKITRIYSLNNNSEFLKNKKDINDKSNNLDNDENIITNYNKIFLRENLINESKVLIWSDPDLVIYNKYVKDELQNNNIVGIISEKINFDYIDANLNFFPMSKINELKFETMVICSPTPKLALRILNENYNVKSVKSIGSVITFSNI